MDLGLKGKSALVTGASEGIGKAIARKLAEDGVRVAVCARTEATLKEAAASSRSRPTCGASPGVRGSSRRPPSGWAASTSSSTTPAPRPSAPSSSCRTRLSSMPSTASSWATSVARGSSSRTCSAVAAGASSTSPARPSKPWPCTRRAGGRGRGHRRPRLLPGLRAGHVRQRRGAGGRRKQVRRHLTSSRDGRARACPARRDHRIFIVCRRRPSPLPCGRKTYSGSAARRTPRPGGA